jgi:transposase
VNEANTVPPRLTIGIDLGDRVSHVCVLDASGKVRDRLKVTSNRESFEECFRSFPASRVVMEVGTMSPWVSRTLIALGHDVLVANSRKLPRVNVKTDRVDAERLARWARIDPDLLHPVVHRSPKTQCHLSILRARDVTVRARTKLINFVRGSSKAVGVRLPSCTAEKFPDRVVEHVPPELADAVMLVLPQIRALTATIEAFDDKIGKLCATEYKAATTCMRQVYGVGPVTALAYTLVIESPSRIRSSRAAGAYLGLAPRTMQSGSIDPQLSISRAGNALLRKLLITSAQLMLKTGARDSALRRLGLRLMLVGGKAAKKRAVVAIARRLAVLLHHLWKTGEVYDPMRGVAPVQPTAPA